MLFETSDSHTAWRISRDLIGPLYLAALQRLNVENRILREIESAESSGREKAVSAAALQRFRVYLSEQIFVTMPLDYDVAIHLAGEWQRQLSSGNTPPVLLLLWPALAVTSGASHFLSFDPRTRKLATAAGLQLLPASL